MLFFAEKNMEMQFVLNEFIFLREETIKTVLNSSSVQSSAYLL